MANAVSKEESRVERDKRMDSLAADATERKNGNKSVGRSTSYIFYDPKNFEKPAMKIYNIYNIPTYSPVELVPVNSLEEFVKKWNNISDSGENVDFIAMMFHGSSHHMLINQRGNQAVTVTGKTNYKSYSVCKVADLHPIKCNEIDLWGCDSGDTDSFGVNIASEFTRHNDVKKVVAFDGNIAYWSGFPSLSCSQNEKGGREPQGKVTYYKKPNGEIGYEVQTSTLDRLRNYFF